MSEKSALILGGTGAVGSILVHEILESGKFTKVTAVGRRQFEYDGPNGETLEQKVVDFENLEAHKEAFKGSFDTVFCTLGTTRALAGSAERFLAIDKGYVINSAKILHEQNPHLQIHFLYCSSVGAHPQSMFLYMRTKGEIEQELGEIGFDRVSLFRPAMFEVEKMREDRGRLSHYFLSGILNISKVLRPRGWIKVRTVAKSMLNVALGETKDVTPQKITKEHGTKIEIFENAQMLDIGN
ncbi:hypothetical protein G9A89_014710 [Geosiphon pyriformis]|nr:hypothetical protein G9A89_014710 [Geosiphon pyriformis]